MTDDGFPPLMDHDETTGSVPNERGVGAARKSATYELFMLGELMDGPHHGYRLREILSRMLGPFRQISWGVLYPLIRQLEREELIVVVEEAGVERTAGTGSGKQRKSYRITEGGRKRFYELMEEQDDYGPDSPENFTIKLNNFDHISHEHQLAVLWHYQGYLEAMNFYLRSGQQYVSSSSDVPDDQRSHILRTISYRTSSVEAELAWLEREIACLEKESKDRS